MFATIPLTRITCRAGRSRLLRLPPTNVSGSVRSLSILLSSSYSSNRCCPPNKNVVIGSTTAGSSRTNSNDYCIRTLKTKAPGSDPLDVMLKESLSRSLCDESGGRLPGAHWVICISIAGPNPHKAPSLRTVGIERVSSCGIDFVMKRGHQTAELLVQGHPLSFLHTQGKHIVGERAEQWRGEGHCEALPLSEVLDLIPHFTLTSMVGSRRLKLEQEQESLKEMQKDVSPERLALLNKSHFIEVVQRTRIELENGDISLEELDQSIRAFRLKPDRVECMLGGPDTVMWDRWEWLREQDDECPEGSVISWSEPKHLLPH